MMGSTKAIITVMREWRNTTIFRFLPVRVQVCRRNAMVTGASRVPPRPAYDILIMRAQGARFVESKIFQVYIHVLSTLCEGKMYTGEFYARTAD